MKKILIIISCLMMLGYWQFSNVLAQIETQQTTQIKTNNEIITDYLKSIDPNYQKKKWLPDNPFYFLKIWGQDSGYLFLISNAKTVYGAKIMRGRLEESLILSINGQGKSADKSLKAFIWIAKKMAKRNFSKYNGQEIARSQQLVQMLNMLEDSQKPSLAGEAGKIFDQIQTKIIADELAAAPKIKPITGKVTEKYDYYFAMVSDGKTYFVNNALAAQYEPKELNFDNLQIDSQVTVTIDNNMVATMDESKQYYEISAGKINGEVK